MLTVALLALPALRFIGGDFHLMWLAVLAIPLFFATAGPTVLYAISQRYLYPDDWIKRVLLLPALVLVGFGICLSNTRAVLEAVFGVKSGFVRTPKSGATSAKTYRAGPSAIPLLEIAAGIYCIVSLGIFLRAGYFGIAPFLLLYTAGFLLVGISSLREQRRPA